MCETIGKVTATTKTKNRTRGFQGKGQKAES